MNRRVVVMGVAAAAVVGSVLPTFAAQSLPVTVHTSTDNGVAVGVDVNNSPGAAVVVRNGQACAGLGEDIPVCTPPITVVGPR